MIKMSGHLVENDRSYLKRLSLILEKASAHFGKGFRLFGKQLTIVLCPSHWEIKNTRIFVITGQRFSRYGYRFSPFIIPTLWLRAVWRIYHKLPGLHLSPY